MECKVDACVIFSFLFFFFFFFINFLYAYVTYLWYCLIYKTCRSGQVSMFYDSIRQFYSWACIFSKCLETCKGPFVRFFFFYLLLLFFSSSVLLLNL